jgi:hypothetical protein
MEVDSTAGEAYEDIPLVRGGMCWYGNVFLVGADFGEKHEVTLLILPNRLMIRYVYIIAMLPT